MATMQEQETTVTHIRSDSVVSIYSANPAHIRRMRKDERFTFEREYTDENGEVEAVEVTIPADQFHPITGLKKRRKPMTDEQRAAAGERLRAAREAKE